MMSRNKCAVSITDSFNGEERREEIERVHMNLAILGSNHSLYAVDYLISPSTHYKRQARVGAGTAILVIYYVLFLLVVSTYFRTLLAVNLDPGYIPRGASWAQNREEQAGFERNKANRDRQRHKREKRRARSRSGATEKTGHSEVDVDVEEGTLSIDEAPKLVPLDLTDVETFYTKDIFVCEDDGRPAYCTKCYHFKTDRAHHCREVDRCVKKMDHFCPWYLSHLCLNFGFF